MKVTDRRVNIDIDTQTYIHGCTESTSHTDKQTEKHFIYLFI